MAILNNGILGKISGPLGIYRFRVDAAGNNRFFWRKRQDARTPAQIEKRRIFLSIVKFGSKFYRSVLKPNVLVSYPFNTALDAWVAWNVPTYWELIGLPVFTFFNGALPEFRNWYIGWSAYGPQWYFGWSALSNPQFLPTDRVQFVFIQYKTLRYYISPVVLFGNGGTLPFSSAGSGNLRFSVVHAIVYRDHLLTPPLISRSMWAFYGLPQY